MITNSPKEKLLRDLRKQGAEIVEFKEGAYYLVAVDPRTTTKDDAGKLVEVLNTRGVYADVIMIEAPSHSLSVYEIPHERKEVADNGNKNKD